MVNFSTQPIAGINPGGVLIEARLKLGLSCLEISKILKLPPHYLEAMEAGNWQVLPTGAYRKFFIRQYANFLEVPAEPLFRKVSSGKIKHQPGEELVDQATKHFPWRTRALYAAGSLFLIYLLWAGWTTFWPPQLNLINPVQDFTTTEASVTVEGSSRAGTAITINNAPVGVSETGKFIAQIPLTAGINTVTVSATKSLGRKVEVTRQILYVPDQQAVGDIPLNRLP
ncbi:MAG: helix-turn-helix domain-containing protein [Patescibacteria group bacterium]